MNKSLLACLTLIALTVSSGCGYALAGRGSFLPDYIQVVGVPSFLNKTSAFEIERVLTDRVRTEFSSRGKYRVQPDTNNVDAILTGTIVNVQFANTAYTSGSQAARLQLIVTASFEFRDVRENKVIWTRPSMIFREEFEPTTASGTDAAAFLGGNANALERLAQTFARSLVTTILEAF
jgi:outer membrane lipopolysaccharide assembly protein LptE/RlpB